jgi:hypothetical protein
MKRTLSIALAILGITFNLSPVHAWEVGGLEGQYTCKDIVSVSKLVAGGTNWTSSQTSYAHAVLREAEQVAALFLRVTKQKAKEGDRDAQNWLGLLAEKGLGGKLSVSDLTLKAMQRVHLAEARVKSLGLIFPSCIFYGMGAYAGT